jgi:hypothetical protein
MGRVCIECLVMYLEYLKKSMNQLISTDLHRRTATISSPTNGRSPNVNDLLLKIEQEEMQKNVAETQRTDKKKKNEVNARKINLLQVLVRFSKSALSFYWQISQKSNLGLEKL